MHVVFFDFVTQYGGAPRVLVEVAARLSKHVRVSFLDPYGACPPYLEAIRLAGLDCTVLDPDARRVVVGGAGASRVARLAASLPGIWRLRSRARRFLADSQASVTCSYSPKALYTLAPATRRLGVPMVAYAQGWFMRGLPDSLPPYAARIMRRDCGAVIAVSEPTKASIRHAGVPTERIAVIHNTVDFEDVQARSIMPLAGELPHRDRPVRILVAANMLRTKGQHTAIRALRRVRDHGLDAVLWLAGGIGIGDTTGYVEWTHRLAAELDVSDHVAWLGVRTDVPQLMHAATFVALPTYTEGFSRVVVEAMALGKPVASPMVGGNPDLILPGLTGYTHEVEDDQGLAECIISAAEDPATAQRIAAEGRRYIRTSPRFEPENHTRRLLEVLRKAVEGVPVADAGFKP